MSPIYDPARWRMWLEGFVTFYPLIKLIKLMIGYVDGHILGCYRMVGGGGWKEGI